MFSRVPEQVVGLDQKKTLSYAVTPIVNFIPTFLISDYITIIHTDR